MLPNKPPEEVLRFAAERHTAERNAIIYRVRSGRNNEMECTCSACGGTYIALRAHSGEGCNCYTYGISEAYRTGTEVVGNRMATLCPMCGAEVTAYHTSDINRYGDVTAAEVILQLTTIDGHSAAVSWIWRRIIFKDGHAETLITPFEAYVFVKKKCFRYSGWRRWFLKKEYFQRFFLCARCSDELGNIPAAQVAPFPPDVWDGTELENAKIDRFLRESDPKKTYPVTYMRSFQQHPQAENLIMQGFSDLFNQLIYANVNHYYGRSSLKIPTQGICWRGKRPAELLMISTEQFRAARAQRWTLDELELVREANEHGIGFDVAAYRTQQRFIEYYDAKRCVGFGVDPLRALEYVRKKNRKKKNSARLNLLMDYYGLCKKTGVKLEAGTAFPADLKREHDRLTEIYNQQNINKKADGAKKYNAAFVKLAREYAVMKYTDEGLCIRIAEQPRELFEEGVRLGHCVGNYVESHSKGKRCIFFIRRTEKPDEPYYTLELDTEALEVLQNRGKKNRARTPEVTAFEAHWLAYIRAQKDAQKGA